MLSNVNLTREEERRGRERFQTDMCECEGVIPDDNVTGERRGDGGLRFMYVFFNVNSSGGGGGGLV